MGGSFSATNRVLPVPEGGWPWGGRFQLQTMYSRFRLEKPVQRALISGASRLNVCTDFPDGGEAVWPDPGTLAQDPPHGPF